MHLRGCQARVVVAFEIGAEIGIRAKRKALRPLERELLELAAPRFAEAPSSPEPRAVPPLALRCVPLRRALGAPR